MSSKWTPAREQACVRDSKGRFKRWKGGKTKADYTQTQLSYRAHGIRVHIGKEFKRQHGRTAREGDVVRTKNKDGSYNKGAEWYVYTSHGWRNSNSHKRPTQKQVDTICSNARKSKTTK
jgi:hypothetical protein